MLWWMLGCPLVESPEPKAQWPSLPPPPPPPVTCGGPAKADARAPDFDDWGVGLPLTFEVRRQPVEEPETLVLTVRGADAGARLELHAGALGALACPADRLGACFQPVDGTVIAEATTDAQGEARVEVPVAEAWREDWVVLQATDPDARALSQPWVETFGAPRALPGPDPAFPVSLASLRNVATSSPVRPTATLPAGVVAQVHYEPGVDVQGSAAETGTVVLSSAHQTLTHTFDLSAEDVALPVRAPAQLLLSPSPSLWYGYGLDLSVRQADRELDWYVDSDGDGFGDLRAAPTVLKALALSGHSAALLGDCDDGNPARFPGAPDRCGDDVDDDCDRYERPCARLPWMTALSEVGTQVQGATGMRIGAALGRGRLTRGRDPELLALGDCSVAIPGSRERASEAAVARVPARRGTVRDLDGDGLSELIVIQAWQERQGTVTGLRVLGEEGSVRAWLPLEHPSLASFAVGDVDGDEDLDLVVSQMIDPRQGENRIALALFRGPLSGALTPDVRIARRSHSPVLVALADSTGDGRDDLWTSEVCMYASPLREDLPPAGCATPGGGHGTFTAGDVDGDGHADGVLSPHSLEAFVVFGPLTADRELRDPANARLALLAGFAGPLAVLSPSGDGPTLAVAVDDNQQDAGHLMLFEVRAPGLYTEEQAHTLALDARVGALLAEDLDGDGVEDLAVGMPGGSVGANVEGGLVRILWGE